MIDWMPVYSLLFVAAICAGMWLIDYFRVHRHKKAHH